MTILRDQMKMNLQLKGFSPKTQIAYLKSVENYALYYGKSPELLNTQEIKIYLHHLVTTQKVSGSYINIVYSALKFLYETTLDRAWDLRKIPRTKTAKKLPVLLAPSEIKSIFDVTMNPKHKVLLMTIYAAGLRVSEAVNLKVADIDSKNMQIRVRHAKGKKDRYTLLSVENLKMLRLYWRLCKPKEWLFPGSSPEQPMSIGSMQSVFYNARRQANIQKNVSIHTLRHCFATHLLEAGTSLIHIQHLLGHASARTTSRYIHLTRKDIMNVKSPLDVLAGLQDE